MDWKDVLGSLKGQVPEAEDAAAEITKAAADGQEPINKQTRKLNIVTEKKGRGGKTATIIEGFEIPDDELMDLAKQLKQRLGIGGSARGGEILLQGDCRDKLLPLLRELGFKTPAR